MERRSRSNWIPFVLPIYLLGVLNLAIVFACYSSTSNTASGNLDGSLAAVVGQGCLGFSLFLTACAVFCIYWAANRKESMLPATFATLLAASPLAIYFVRDFLPRMFVEGGL